MLSRGNAAVRLRTSIRPPLWPGRLVHTGYCSFQRSRTIQTNKAAERVSSPTSRALDFLMTSRRHPESLQQYLSRTNGIQEEALILQSRFPRKTALAVLILFGLFWYYGESDMASWVARVEQSYIEEGNDEATPIHFYKDKETLERKTEWLKMWDGLDIRDPRLSAEEVQNVTKEFDNFVDGWVTSEKVSKELNIPTTHGCRFMSNSPCEDYHALGTSPGPGTKPWNYWAVMDGHAGRHTAATLQWWLLPHVSSELCALPSSCSAFEIESTIKKSFLQLDDKIMNAAQMASKWYPVAHFKAIDALAPAISGSCALLAAFDPSSSVLRVACTGDSRAVLGRWDPDTSSYTAIPLSEDQTGFNQKEVARLAADHPDEPDIIDPKTGRLLGIAVTRAFGDHRWKWDNDLVKEVQYRFFGTSPRSGNKTPPYMTAEPEVTETRIVRADAAESHPGKKRSDFMIMASDGLWDRISSEHAVECVARWLDARDRGKGKVSNDPHLRDRPPVYSLRPDDGVTVDVEQGKEVDWKATPEYFAIEDDNAATCLVRNAMGGTRLGLFFALLAIPRPWSRYAVDDTTVMVVFFDKTGDGK